MEKRRSQRMKAVLPIRMSGHDLGGGPYCDLAHTIDITPTGARLGTVRRPVSVGGSMLVQYRHRKAEFKIVWTTKLRGAESEYWIGLEAVAQKDPWGFSRPTALLDETTISAATANSSSREGVPETITNPESEQKIEVVPRRARTKMKMTACICQPGSEDVVEVANISRGGVCFRSTREYVADTFVRVSAPYTPGMANIFVIGRVAWQRLASGNANECGIEYVQSSGTDAMAQLDQP
ncbi:MAG: PilZ domain-containing protein [Terriglobales bacterium]